MYKDSKDTSTGLVVLTTIILVYVVVFASYYPLSIYLDFPMLGVFLESPATLLYLIFGLIGLGLVIKNSKKVKRFNLIISAVLACLVWISVQSQYHYNNWTPIIPFYAPTVNALEVFFMALGFGVMGIGPPWFSLEEANYKKTGKSLGIGLFLGILLGLINLFLFVFLYDQRLELGNILYGCLKALKPGIMEEVTYRLFFMGTSIFILRKYLPKRLADTSAISMAVLFHAILHVYQFIWSDPISAVVTVIGLSVIFGLPMAMIAYKRDIETSICLHWTIDAIRFILIG